MVIIDPRLEQVTKIVKSLFSKTLSCSTDCLITADNNLVLIVDKTLLYIIPLKGETNYIEFAFNYDNLLSQLPTDKNAKVDFSNTGFDIGDMLLMNYIKSTYLQYVDFCNSIPIVAYNDNLRLDENFENLVSNANSITSYYKMPGNELGQRYMIPIIKSFPNLCSKDTIGISVRNLDNIHSLIDMNIYKKNINRNFHILYRILNI